MAAQVAGELYYEIDGQLAEIKRQLRQTTGYPFDPALLKVALQNAIEGKFSDMKTPSWLSVIATTNLDATAAKKTNKCFTDSSRYYSRDADFDWLQSFQPKADACTITTLGFTKDWTFVEAAAKILGIGAGSSTKLLGQALIENGHTMTLAQVEAIVEATERSEKTGMQTNGYGNFFFVETGNEDDPVSVAYVLRGGSRWDACVDGLGHGRSGFAVSRLLVRNLDASKLRF